MVDYLESWQTGTSAPNVPRGIFAGAKRFLNQVLEGVAVNRRQRFREDIPIMAGITNLTIALGVLHRLAPPADDLDAVERRIQQYLRCLEAVESDQSQLPALHETARDLQEFFRGLLEQGKRERHAAFARAEAPGTRT
jgi:hypothetical protein